MASKARRTPPVVKADPVIVIDGETADTAPGEVLEGEVLEGEVPGGETTSEEDLHHGFVEFRGRTIEVRAPELEQVVIIRRLQVVFSDASRLENITAERAVKLMDRALKAITSVTVNPEDVEFIEDLWLDRKLKLEETLPLMTASMKALEAANADTMNRAKRRAAQQKKSGSKTGRASLVTD